MSYNFLDKTGLAYFWSKIKAKFDSFSRNDLAVIDSREYSGIYGSANDQANASFYFGGIKPNNYYDVWKVKFRVYSNVPNQNEYKQYSDVEYYGSKNDLSYKIYNRMANTGGRCYYYHNVCRLNATGFNAGYKHILGMGLRASNNPTSSSYPRYFKIELLETDKCTFTFYDSMKKISAISEYNTTNYSGISEYDGCNNGLRESGDDNDISNLRIENGSIIAGTNGVKQNSLCAMDSTGKYQSFTTTDGTGTSKTVNSSTKFRNPMIIFKNNSGTNYANGAEVGTGYQSYYASPSVDLRYSCNNFANFTKNTPTYLECTKDSDGYFSVTSNIILQTGFTSGRYYIYLGNTRRDQIYLMDLQTYHPIFYYDGNKLINENELKANKTVATGSANGLMSSADKTKVDNIDRLLTSENLNNIVSTGTYYGGGSNTVTNKPTGVDAFGLKVFKTAAGFITQELIEGNTTPGARWTRQQSNNTWSSWTKMLWTDTTYTSKAAASGGTDVSLVTTGEKYTWNSKTSNTGTVTSVAVKMNGATKGTVTSSGTIDLGTVVTDVSGKQDKLVSGTNIKTINNTSILGSGNINIGGGITALDVYPVGSIYMSMNDTDPGILFGGTWVQIVNQFLFGAGQGYSAGDTGGEATHQLTKAELPSYDLYNASHSHNFKTYSGYGGRSGTMPAVNGGTNQGTFTATPDSATIKVSSGGSDTPHNNMPPYLVVYMWQRTA